MCFIRYNREQLLKLATIPRGYTGLDNKTIQSLKDYKLFQYRSSRGGKKLYTRPWDTNQGIHLNNLKALPQVIETIKSKRQNQGVEPNTVSSETRYSDRTLTRIKPNSLPVVQGQKKLTVCSINCRPIKNKTLAICDFILSNDFDLVAITETWLGTKVDKVCVNELLPDGYNIKHVPRMGKEGGGVAIVYKSAIQIKVLSSSNEKGFQTIRIHGL
jgi:hypothetical protein